MLDRPRRVGERADERLISEKFRVELTASLPGGHVTRLSEVNLHSVNLAHKIRTDVDARATLAPSGRRSCPSIAAVLGGVIRGKIATLRVPTEADLADYSRWMADPRVRRGGWVWHEPAMLATWKERLAEIAKDRQQVLWSIDEKETLVGLCVVTMGGAEQSDAVSFDGLVIAPPAQRRGIGADAVLALHRYLFDYLHTRVADAVVAADATAALGLLERLGYIRYARGANVRYREGARVDELSLRFDRATWDERWAPSEREYQRHAPEAAL